MRRSPTNETNPPCPWLAQAGQIAAASASSVATCSSRPSSDTESSWARRRDATRNGLSIASAVPAEEPVIQVGAIS